MRLSGQVDRLKLLKETLASSCDKVRFSSEFCEWKLPSLSELKKAFAYVEDAGKEFNYVTPRCSDNALKKIISQLNFLNGKGEIEVIINDLGLLNVLDRYDGLKPHLGRRLVHIPARCPWFEIDPRSLILFGSLIAGTIMKRHVKDLYAQTSLHYEPTIRFYKEHKVSSVDLDWIPKCFPYLKFLIEHGLEISLHIYLVPVTITRKCHTARFLGERTPENCSKPCDKKAFLLEHKGTFMSVRLYLHGNAVFRLVQPEKKDVRSLLEIGVSELVISMNPVTNILNRERIDEVISSIKSMGNMPG